MTDPCRVYGGDVAVNESVVMNETKLPFVTTREQTRRFHCVNGRYGYLIMNLDQQGPGLFSSGIQSAPRITRYCIHVRYVVYYSLNDGQRVFIADGFPGPLKT